MFGYVNVNQGELKVREYQLYQSYYCGLCKKLKEKYGRLGQLTLSYDMTFLVILLTALYECPKRRKKAFCFVHPTRKKLITETDFTEYGADMTVVLTYHHFLDDWQDDKNLAALSGAKLLTRHYRKLEKRYPRQCRAVKNAVEKLGRAEKENCQDLDLMAGYMGEMLSQLFVPQKDVWTEQLQKMGMGIGRFIYLMDAYEDLEEDRKKGRYNPLFRLSREKDFEETCETVMRIWMAEAADAFEKLPVLIDGQLLRNILYAGVWVRYDRIRAKKAEEAKKDGSL